MSELIRHTQIFETTTVHLDDRADVVVERWELPGEVPLGLTRRFRPGGATRSAVVLVHGFAQNRYTWHTSRRSWATGLARAGFDVWNLELRGHGYSRPEGQLGAESFSDYVDDVVAVAKALPGPAFFVGHSLGGAAIYGAATVLAGTDRSPLGVVGIGAVYSFGRGNPVLRAAGVLTHTLGERIPGLSKVQVRSREFGRVVGRLYGLTDVLGYTVPVSGWWPGSIEPELLAERLEEGFDWTSVRVWQEMSRWAATGGFDYDEPWRQTDVPLYVLLGDKDHLLPPEDGRVAFDRSGSTDKTLLLLSDWEHEVHWGHLDLVLGRKAPDHVWPRVEEWMVARCPRTTGSRS
jgi:polyhydroxyalkanoate synthase